MTYPIISYPAQRGSYTPHPNGRPIRQCVIHATAGVKAGDLYTLSGRDARHRVSCHYYVTKQGEIFQLVADQDEAWHAGVCSYLGVDDWNQHSLGFEIENLNNGRDPYPQPQLDAVVWIVRSKVHQYAIEPSFVQRHLTVAVPRGRKSDPRGFPWEWFRSQVFASTPTPTPAPQVWRTISVVALRSGPERKAGNIVTMLRDGEFVPGTVVNGESVAGDTRWVWRDDQRGFVHMSALRPVNIEQNQL